MSHLSFEHLLCVSIATVTQFWLLNLLIICCCMAQIDNSKKTRTETSEVPDSSEIEMAADIRNSQILLSIGLGEGARFLARRAVEDFPESATAWRNLAEVSTHGPLGRKLVRDFDFESAIEAYSKAIELDKNDQHSVWQLGVLYEHQPNGNHYVNREQLKLAIEQYEKLNLDQYDTKMTIRYLLALNYAGQYEKTVKFFQRSDTIEYPTLYLVAVCMQQGAQKSFAELKKIDSTSAGILSLGSRVYWNLMSIGEYKDAGEFYEIANSDSILDSIKAVSIVPPNDSPQFDAVRGLLNWTFNDRNDYSAAQEFFYNANVKQIQQFVCDSHLKFFPHLGGELPANEIALSSTSKHLDFLIEQCQYHKIVHGYIVHVETHWTDNFQDVWAPRYQCYLVKTPKGEGQEQAWKILLPGGDFRHLGSYLFELLNSDLEEGELKKIQTTFAELLDTYDFYALNRTVKIHVEKALKFRRLSLQNQLQFASAILAARRGGAEVVQYLENLRSDLTGDSSSICEQALFVAQFSNGNNQAAARTLEKIKSKPGQIGFSHDDEIRFYSETRRFEQVEDILEQYQETVNGLYQQARVDVLKGDFARANERLRDTVSAGNSDFSLANAYVWNSMFSKETPSRGIEAKLKRAVKSQKNNDVYAHTMATLMATKGENVDAMDYLRTCCDRKGVGRYVEPDDEYVMGVVARNLGFDDVAIDYFQRSSVAYAPSHSNAQTALLARRQLLEMGVEPEGVATSEAQLPIIKP